MRLVRRYIQIRPSLRTAIRIRKDALIQNGNYVTLLGESQTKRCWLATSWKSGLSNFSIHNDFKLHLHDKKMLNKMLAEGKLIQGSC